MAVLTNMLCVAASLTLFSLASAVPSEHLSAALRQKQTGKCPINSVCFAIDQSGSVSGFYPTEQKFVVEIAKEIASRTTDTAYSAYGFSFSSNKIQGSTKDLTGTFIPAVNKQVSPFGSTNMYAGLNSCYGEVKNSKGNKLIVLVTDGKDTGNPGADELAPTIKKAGVSIVTVGIGSIDEQYLKDLASGPQFFVKSSSFAQLLSKVITVAEDACKVVSTTPPPVTPAPGTPAPQTPAPPTPAPTDACARAYDACDFKFVGRKTVPTFSVTGKPDVPFTVKIVSRKKREKLGILNSNNIIPQFILADGRAVDITSVTASQSFTPTHFKPYTIKGKHASGIGHQTYQGNQKSVAQRRCIRVFFSSYQLLSGKPSTVVRNVHVGKSANKCVVFKSA